MSAVVFPLQLLCEALRRGVWVSQIAIGDHSVYKHQVRPEDGDPDAKEAAAGQQFVDDYLAANEGPVVRGMWVRVCFLSHAPRDHSVVFVGGGGCHVSVCIHHSAGGACL
jgi:2-hydroxychromene-2-carboxylate isomerase